MMYLLMHILEMKGEQREAVINQIRVRRNCRVQCTIINKLRVQCTHNK